LRGLAEKRLMQGKDIRSLRLRFDNNDSMRMMSQELIKEDSLAYLPSITHEHTSFD
jgi:hypothetical protein